MVACTLLVGCNRTTTSYDMVPMAGAKTNMPQEQALAICQREAERQHPASAYVISRPAPNNPSPTTYNTTTNCQGYGNTINCQGTATPANNALVNNARRYRAQGLSAWDGHISNSRRNAAITDSLKTCLAAKGFTLEKKVTIKKNQSFLCGGPMPVFAADSSVCN